VDDAPQTNDLDLAGVTTRDGFLALLRVVYLRADRPSLRILEARTRHHAVPLSKTVASELVRGARFPRKVVMLAFLQACGVQGDRLEPWQRAWERIAVQEAGAARVAGLPGQDPGPGPSGGSAPASAAGSGPDDEMTQLREENRELRRRLAGSGSGAAALQQYRDDDSRGEEAGNPVVSRRELGASLRALRLERGLTVEQVAGHLLCSAGKVSRMESGFRSGTLRDVRDLCSLYGVPEGPRRDHLMDLARQSRRQGWWQAYPQVPAGFEPYLGLEDGASSIRTYECAVVHGLLQTEDYARAVLAVLEVLVESNYLERTEELVQVRLARQRRLLTRPDPPDFWVILDEAVLRRTVGGPEVMRGQFEHLVEASRSPNVTLQVIPFAAGAHSAPGSSFSILEFPGKAPGMVHLEGLQGFTYLERATHLRRYQQVFDDLSARALGEEESMGLITATIRETGGSRSAGAR
jgi:transcriptional regulator with XRE-family HTH domain